MWIITLEKSVDPDQLASSVNSSFIFSLRVFIFGTLVDKNKGLGLLIGHWRVKSLKQLQRRTIFVFKCHVQNVGGFKWLPSMVLVKYLKALKISNSGPFDGIFI